MTSPKGDLTTSPKGPKGKVGAIPEEAEEHEDELIPKKRTSVKPDSKSR
jgi:hypothetical protein